ncbi:MAG TPA: DUF1508 domain-containing protein [Micrococcaceae bacterium]|jgi:hypothetical protein|nr:DUF1508 domain-containing protein [Micrococcaceae bacterium]
MTGTFELIVNNQGDFRFRILSGSGDVLAESGPYFDKDGAVKGIDSVRESASMALITDHTAWAPRPKAAVAPQLQSAEAASRWFG